MRVYPPRHLLQADCQTHLWQPRRKPVFPIVPCGRRGVQTTATRHMPGGRWQSESPWASSIARRTERASAWQHTTGSSPRLERDTPSHFAAAWPTLWCVLGRSEHNTSVRPSVAKACRMRISRVPERKVEQDSVHGLPVLGERLLAQMQKLCAESRERPRRPLPSTLRPVYDET